MYIYIKNRGELLYSSSFLQTLYHLIEICTQILIKRYSFNYTFISIIVILVALASSRLTPDICTYFSTYSSTSSTRFLEFASVENCNHRTTL